MFPIRSIRLLVSARRVGARLAHAGLLALVALGATALPAPARAAAPVQHAQAPGWYRFMVGDFEVTALSDGTVDLTPEKLLREPPAKTTKSLAEAYLTSPVETSVNAFLVNTGARLVLIDAGAGGFFGPTLGRLAANLEASGYRPEQVDDVFITHMHPDHVGGLVASGAPVFPNATIHADRRDADFWLSEATLQRSPPDSRAFVQDAMASLKPYVAAGRFQTFVADAELVPGVRSWSTYGHTAGHTSYIVHSKGARLVVIGDLVHVGAVQLADPTVAITFDMDPKAAVLARADVFKRSAKEGDLIGAAHLPFPGVGHLRSAGRGWQWLPLNYTRLP
jgi:glyoxylase-like metal-dependent hydrolase (beta-lactamase superfamily II)